MMTRREATENLAEKLKIMAEITVEEMMECDDPENDMNCLEGVIKTAIDQVRATLKPRQ